MNKSSFQIFFLILGTTTINCQLLKNTTSEREVEVTHEVLFDVSKDGTKLGTITIGLFGKSHPLAVANFAQLASENGWNGYKYQGSKFYRIVKKGLIEGGDIKNNDGTGSVSIYGSPFEDESNVYYKHNEPGMVGYFKKNQSGNGSIFYISAGKLPILNNGRNLVFGKVTLGMDIVKQINELPVNNANQKPLSNVVISKSQVFPLIKKKFVTLVA